MTIEIWLAAVGVALGAGGIVVARNQWTRISIALFVLVLVASGVLGARLLDFEEDVAAAEKLIIEKIGAESKTHYQVISSLSDIGFDQHITEEALSRLLKTKRLGVTSITFFARESNSMKESSFRYSTLFYCNPEAKRQDESPDCAL